MSYDDWLAVALLAVILGDLARFLRRSWRRERAETAAWRALMEYPPRLEARPYDWSEDGA